MAALLSRYLFRYGSLKIADTFAFAWSIIGSSNGRGAILRWYFVFLAFPFFCGIFFSTLPSKPLSNVGAYFTSVVIAGFIVNDFVDVPSDAAADFQLVRKAPLRTAGGSPGADAV
jgi:4-hydroxybenzoate polyprenyltransferase